MDNGDLLLLAVADVTVDGQRLEGVGVKRARRSTAFSRFALAAVSTSRGRGRAFSAASNSRAMSLQEEPLEVGHGAPFLS
jgi:hypothetical protein